MTRQSASITVIIVLSVQSASGRREFGVVVDGVSDVMDIDGNSIKPAHNLGMHASQEFIAGNFAISHLD